MSVLVYFALSVECECVGVCASVCVCVGGGFIGSFTFIALANIAIQVR